MLQSRKLGIADPKAVKYDLQEGTWHAKDHWRCTNPHIKISPYLLTRKTCPRGQSLMRASSSSSSSRGRAGLAS